jgi:hypothetical protein
MADTTVVSVKIPRDTKQTWEEYAEENPDVDSVSHLIRLSVMKEMNASDEPETGSSVEQAEASAEVLESLKRIQNSISEVDDRLTAIEKESKAEGPGFDVQNTVFEVLPELAMPPSLPPEDIDGEGAVSSSEVAESVGLPEEDVSKALIRLHENMSQVVRAKGTDGELLYWTEP